MVRKTVMAGILGFFGLFLLLLVGAKEIAAIEQKIYDDANLLDEAEIEELEELAKELAEEIGTDLIVLTTTSSMDVDPYTKKFYEEMAPGYDKPHGSTVILTINMEYRDVYLESFGRAYDYLTSSRLTDIRESITPYLSNGEYFQAFENFMYFVYDYMIDSEPPSENGGSNIPPSYGGNFPSGEYNIAQNDSIVGQLWFQILISVIIGLAGVGFMAMNAGGKVTVNERTYLNHQTSRVLRKRDNYIRTTVTKRRKPSSNNSSRSGGFGGGIGGGFGGGSHSSRGKF